VITGKSGGGEVGEHRDAILREVVESFDAAVFAVDRQYRYTVFNSRHAGIMKALYGVDIQLGGCLLDYQKATNDHVQARRNLDRALAGESLRDEAYSGEAGRDRRYFVVSHNPVRDASGAVVGVAVFAHDTTERRRMEEELARHAEDLQRSNRDLVQFAYSVSHDLQEPLRMVSGFVQLLDQHLAGKLDAEAREFMGFALEGARRMHEMINSLLEYSRVRTQGREPAPVDAEAALDDALANLRPAIAECGASLSRDPLPAVVADPNQLTRLFQNLVGNALKFHADRAPEVHVSVAREGDFAHFSVRDNGIGIEGRYLDRIFEVFQRLHSREAYPGTGIGLAVCRKIVERHGGRIWAESTPGEGSTFHFTMPLAAPARE
jgi:signal transduction histidine kinase